MRTQCIPVCTCTEKMHSSAGLCWLTLVHIGSHGPQCNQWRLHLHQLWPFPYFPFKLSNSLMPPAFHRTFSSRDMIRTSELHIWGHCLHCIKDATIYCNHVLFLVISILKVSMNLFCHSFVCHKPLLVLCLSFVRPQSDPARSLIDFYLDKCERCPLFVM